MNRRRNYIKITLPTLCLMLFTAFSSSSQAIDNTSAADSINEGPDLYIEDLVELEQPRTAKKNIDPDLILNGNFTAVCDGDCTGNELRNSFKQLLQQSDSMHDLLVNPLLKINDSTSESSKSSRICHTFEATASAYGKDDAFEPKRQRNGQLKYSHTSLGYKFDPKEFTAAIRVSRIHGRLGRPPFHLPAWAIISDPSTGVRERFFINDIGTMSRNPARKIDLSWGLQHKLEPSFQRPGLIYKVKIEVEC